MPESGESRSRSSYSFCVAGLVVLYASAFIVTHLPPSRMPVTGFLSDKVKHFIGFLVLGAATAFVRFVVGRRQATVASIFVAWAAMIGYAFVDEATQPIFDRSFDLGDLAADAIGAIGGLLIGMLLRRRRSDSSGEE